jgi:hypothetical protein
VNETQRGGWWPLIISGLVVMLPLGVFGLYLVASMFAKAGLD